MTMTELDPQVYRRLNRTLIAGAVGIASLTGCSTDTPIAVDASKSVTINSTPTPTSTTPVVEVLDSLGVTEMTTTSLLPPATSEAPASSMVSPNETAEVTQSTLPSPENYQLFNFERVPGALVGSVYTSNGLIQADLYMTDNVTNPTQPFIEHPETDYINEGVGISRAYGMPGEYGNSVLLAHNTKPGSDYFRRLPEVKAGDELRVEYVLNGVKDILVFRAVTDPVITNFDDAGLAAIYVDGQRAETENPYTITTATCNTVGGNTNERVYVVWEFVSIEAMGEPA